MNISEQLKLGKETVALRIITRQSARSEFAHIDIQVCYVKPNSGRGLESMDFYDNYYDQKHQYKGLTISAQMDATADQPYQFEIVVRDHGRGQDTSMREAEAIIKTLKPIHRKLDKIYDTEGAAASFEEYVVRAARVIGAKAFYGASLSQGTLPVNHNIGMLRQGVADAIKQIKQGFGIKLSA